LANPNAVTTSGTYYIKVTTAAGCTDIQPVVVTVNPLPAPVITASQDPVCENTGTVTYSTPLVGCNTYSWIISTGGTIVSGQGTNQIVVQWTTSGTKTVTVTETMCGTGCSKIVNKDFVVTPKPVTAPITHN
jgi:trimeric autotransporter adhesin